MERRDFVAQSHVRARLREFRPPGRGVIDAPMLVAPRNNRSLIGTAFDYLLRFEIGRRSKVTGEPWTAELIDSEDWWMAYAEQIRYELRAFCIQRKEFRRAEIRERVEQDSPLLNRPVEGVLQPARIATDPHEIYFRGVVGRVVRQAREAIAAYRALPCPASVDQRLAAHHAIRLAKVDGIVRRASINPTFENAGIEAIDELMELLQIVPWDQLSLGESPMLNPRLGILGVGADADLICSGCLIDIKTTITPKVTIAFIDQLLSYLIFARWRRSRDSSFPEVTRLGIYFARHAHFWFCGTRSLTDNPRFAEFEKWFLDQTPVMRLKERLQSCQAGEMGTALA
jgi:hypothetical protein